MRRIRYRGDTLAGRVDEVAEIGNEAHFIYVG